jgi:4-amino-4-deoxy-L-arabinose transferase-like glycosyltransferase
MDERRAGIAFWAVLAAAALLMTVGGAALPLFDPDESRFARTSLEMMRSGDLVVPTYEGQPRLVKPPLLHWIQSTLFRLFGASEWVARLPSAAATVASLFIVGWIARRRFGHEGAFWVAAVLGTMPLVVAVGRLGTIDALLSVHILAALALDIAEPKEVGAYRGLAIGGLLGLAFLAKGPVGVVLPLLIMLAGRTASSREILPSWSGLLQGIAGWCVVVLPWGLAFLQRVGIGQAATVIRGEALERYFVGADHVEPAWFYLAVVAVGFFPWLATLVVALPRTLVQRNEPAARTALYAAAGLVVGLFFLSIGKGKLANYALPLAPLAAILVTWELGQELRAPRERIVGPALLSAGLGAVAVGLTLAIGLGLDPVAVGAAGAGAAIYAVGAAAGLIGLLLRRPRWVYGAAASATAAFLVMALVVLVPALSRTRTSAYLIEEVPALRDPARPVVIVDMKVPSLTFYLDRAPQEVDLVDLEARLVQEDDPLIVFDEGDVPRAEPAAMERLGEVGRQGKYIVYSKKADSPRPGTLDEPGGGL